MTDAEAILTLAKAEWEARRVRLWSPWTSPLPEWGNLGDAERAQITEWTSQIFALAKPLILAQAASAPQPTRWFTIASAPVDRPFLAKAPDWPVPAIMGRVPGNDRVFHHWWNGPLVSDDSAPTHWTEIPE